MNIQFPFDLLKREQQTDVVADATHADLLALENKQFKDNFSVRCRWCESRIRYTENRNDPNFSEFNCLGVTRTSYGYTGYGDDYCYNKMKRWELGQLSAAEIARRFFVRIDLPERTLYKMCFEPNGPTSGYHYVREVTQEEHREDALLELERIRRIATYGE